MWAKAEEDFTTTLARDATIADARAGRASVHLARAVWLAGRRGRERTQLAAELRAAASDLAELRARAAQSALGRLAEGDLAWLRGEPQEARAAFERARAEDRSLDRAVAARVTALADGGAPPRDPASLW
jgi:hypothetical protein